MKKMLRASLLSVAIACALVATTAPAHAVDRDSAQAAMFKRHNPCPSTGSTKGECADYYIKHKRPLCMGGANRPFNMTWKKKSASYALDAQERQACSARAKAIKAKRAAKNS